MNAIPELYGWDLDLSRAKLIEEIQRDPKNHQLLHLALSLGLYKDIEEHVQTTNLEPITNRSLRARIALWNGEEQRAFSLTASQEIRDQVQSWVANAQPKILPIFLNGGIGDILQTLSTALAWCSTTKFRIKIQADRTQHRQFQRYCGQLPMISSFEINKDEFYPIQAFRAHFAQATVGPKQLALLDSDRSSDIKNQIICCWRAQAIGEPLSCYARSVTFEEVYKFYKKISNKTKIIDITAWNQSEKNCLHDSGITFHNPAKGDVLDLMHLCTNAKHVITIDTALAHLCAVNNIRAHLLLTLFPDERWTYLLQSGTCYHNNLTIHRQESFGRWATTLEPLISKMNLEG